MAGWEEKLVRGLASTGGVSHGWYSFNALGMLVCVRLLLYDTRYDGMYIRYEGDFG